MTLEAVQCVNVSVCVSEAESASQEWALTEVWWTALTIDHKERRFCPHERALCCGRSAADDSQADIIDLVRLWVGSHVLWQQLTAHALMETKEKVTWRGVWDFHCQYLIPLWKNDRVMHNESTGDFQDYLGYANKQKLFENSIKGLF